MVRSRSPLFPAASRSTESSTSTSSRCRSRRSSSVTPMCAMSLSACTVRRSRAPSDAPRMRFILLDPRQVAPLEGLPLDVFLAQAAGDLRLHQLAPQVEGVRRIALDPELGEVRAHIGRADETLAVVD